MRPTLSYAFLACLVAVSAFAQETPSPRELTLDEVLRPASLLPRAPMGPVFTAGGEAVTWIEADAGGLSWKRLPVAGGDPETLATEAEFAALGEKSGLKGLSLGALADSRWEKDGRARAVARGRVVSIGVKPLSLAVKLEFPEDAEAVAIAPDDRSAAYSKEKDVWVKKADGTTFRVTRGGHEFLTHGLAVSRVEFGIHDGLWWDPTGRRLAFYREDLRGIEPYPWIDWTARPAKHRLGRYPMAGRAGSRVSIGIYDTRDDSVRWLATDPEADEYLTNVTWGPDGEAIHVVHVDRAQQNLALVAYDAASGARKSTLIEERDEQWVEPEKGPLFLKDGSGRFLWFSPRNGFNHVWLHAPDGHLMQQVTHGNHDVTEIAGFPPGYEKVFWYYASGRNPTERHLFRALIQDVEVRVEERNGDVRVDAPEVGDAAITRGRGRHEITISPDGRHLLDQWSALDRPPVLDLVTVQGEPVRRLHAAADPLSGCRLGDESFFTAKTKDGQDLWCHLVLPPGMDRARKHPVIVYVYAGPHSQFVRDEWMSGLGPTDIWLRWMAARGFVILRTDGRGTINRGIEWAQAVHRRLGTLEVEDQMAALDHLAAQGFVDEKRVGVHGWSYGGFMTLSLMTRAAERFRAGVAGAPVTDWRYYETGYGERYMDRPEENEQGYDEADPGRRVGRLEGRLLVVHGTDDDTVVWQNTIDFLDRAVKAGKDVDYFVYPGQLHGLRGRSREHFFRKMTAFFERELAQ